MTLVEGAIMRTWVRRSDIVTCTKTCEGPDLDSQDGGFFGDSVGTQRSPSRSTTSFARAVHARDRAAPRRTRSSRGDEGIPTGTPRELLRNPRKQPSSRAVPAAQRSPGPAAMNMSMFTRTRAQERRRSVSASGEEYWGVRDSADIGAHVRLGQMLSRIGSD